MSSTTHMNDDDGKVLEAGYTPQLRRSIGFFSSFAVSFSSMSVLMGIFANYSYVLVKSGPFGFWTWLPVGAGQFLVALVFAEMAGRIPLTGAIYNWNSRLANATIGWFTAWLLLFAYSIGCVGVIVALMAPLQTLLGTSFDTFTLRCVGVGLVGLQMMINIYGVKLAATTNRMAVIAEFVALAVFGFLLLGLVLVKGEANTTLLTRIPDSPTPYWQSFLMASLLPAWTIFGFELPVDLAEETINVHRVTPKSILLSVAVTVAMGFAFLIIVTLAIPDLTAITASPDPISAIVAYHLGNAPNKIFLILVVIAMFASSMVGLTAASRLLFAVGRDKVVIGSSSLTKISSHGIPKSAVLLVGVIEIAAYLLAPDMAALYAAPVILLSLAYLTTIISFIKGRKKLPATRYFSLGRWHLPVVVLSVAWLVCEICILTLPDDFHQAAEIAGGVIMMGFVLYGLVGRKKVTT